MKTAINQKQALSHLLNILAELYKYPDAEVWDEIICCQLLEKLRDNAAESYNVQNLIEINDIPLSLEDIQDVYLESLGGPVLPIESIYKEWTADETCGLPIAKSKGYLLGDCALHIRYILNDLKIEIPEDYNNSPDHLAILLELLSFFLLHAEEGYIHQFLADHFNWLDELVERLEEIPGNQFYIQITLFLQQILELSFPQAIRYKYAFAKAEHIKKSK